jgi:5-methylcytosine-specific restriction protein A
MSTGLHAPRGFCSVPGCPHRAQGRCAEHQQVRRLVVRRHYTGIPGVNYGRKWQREAKRFKAMHPWCVLCPPSRRSLATVVDHVIPHRGDYDLFWDESNWAPACAPCHSAKTAREVGWGG